MLRFKFALLAVSLAAGAVGCAQCDTCDDFPAPCVGGRCGPQAAGHFAMSGVGPHQGQVMLPPGAPMPPGVPATAPNTPADPASDEVAPPLNSMPTPAVKPSAPGDSPAALPELPGTGDISPPVPDSAGAMPGPSF